MSEGPRRFSATEDAAATPGWVESELDAILQGLPDRPSIRALRSRYLDGLAASRTEGARDACRRSFLHDLEADGVGAGERDALDARLIALESEIASRT